LLSHQSGIPTWEFVPAWIRNARGVHLDPTKHWDSIESLTYVAVVDNDNDDDDDDAKGDATTTTSAVNPPPGERYGYSNTNYTILGHVVEAVTGQSIAHELRQRLLAPLSLRSAFLHYNDTDESDEQREDRESDHDIAMTTVNARCHFPDRLYHYVTETFVRDAGVPINYFDDVILDHNECMLVTSTSSTTGSTTTTQQQRQPQHHEPPNNHHHNNIPTQSPVVVQQQPVQQVQRPPMMDTTRATNLSCEWAAGALCMTMTDLCTLGVALAKMLALYREGRGGEETTIKGSHAGTTATTTTLPPRRHRPPRRMLLGPTAAEQMFTYRPPRCDVMELDGHGFSGSSDNGASANSLRATGKEYCLGICHDVTNDVWQHGGLTLSFSTRLMILSDGTVIACATNVGQMHSGFGDGQSPWDQFVANTLLPAVRTFLASANSTSITATSSS
jgi:CubicO group peptidase (beta-lactamase class C family)